jgi:hypothetical protein
LNDDRLLKVLREESLAEEAVLREIEASAVNPARDAALLDAATSRAVAQLGRAHAPGVRRPRRAPWMFAAVPAIAIAAGVALFVGTKESPLPAYDVALLAGGVSAERAISAKPSVLRAGAEVDLLLRPTTRVSGKVTARAFIAGPALRPWAATIEVQPSGVVRVHGLLDVRRDSAAAFVIVVLGREGSVPSDPDAIAREIGGASAPDREIVRIPVAPTP